MWRKIAFVYKNGIEFDCVYSFVCPCESKARLYFGEPRWSCFAKKHVNELCKFGFTVTEFAFSRFGSKQQKSTPVVQPLVRSKWNGPLPVRTTINQLDGKVSNMPQFSSTFCLFNERYSRPKKKCHYVIANGTTH